MRRERVAAIDPFAVPPANTGGSSSSNNNDINATEKQQPAPPQPPSSSNPTSSNSNNTSGFVPVTTSFTSSYQQQRSTPSLLFDPFFKASTKSHQSSNKVPSTTTKGPAPAKPNNNNDNHTNESSSITSTLGSLFDQSAAQHAKVKKEEADEKWKLENEGSLLTPFQIVTNWKEESSVDFEDLNNANQQQLVSFVGQRKSAVGMALSPVPSSITSTSTTVGKKEEEGQQQVSEDDSNTVKKEDSTTTATTSFSPLQKNLATSSIPFSGLDSLPEVEWWDRRFLSAPSYALGPSKQLPVLGGTGAVSGFDTTITSFAMNKATAVVYDAEGVAKLRMNQDSASTSTTTTTICALPKKVGWNPTETEAKEQENINNSNEHAEKMKTAEELKKERHARRVAAAQQKQDELRASRADQHNFGLQRSIKIEGQDDDNGKDAATSNDATKPTEASNAILLHDKVKMKHLETVLLKDVLLNPSIKDEVANLVQARMQKHLEDNERRHIEAKDYQIDHQYEVDKRHATTSPRVSVIRCLGVTDNNTLQRFKIICKQDLLLRGTFIWIRKRFLIAILVGGEKAIRAAEQTFLERFKGNGKILRDGANIDVVWGCTISDFAFNRSFLIENSPFERDGRHKKPESVIKRENEIKQQQANAGAAANTTNNNIPIHEREYRRKFESIKILEVPTMMEAKVWFSRNNFDFAWDAVVKTPVEMEESVY